MSPDPNDPRHPIRVAAERSGLTPELLRAWENRYGVVEPGRTEGGQRRYSDRDVERLRILRLATEAGRRIGDVADLPEDELAALVREDAEARLEARPATIPRDTTEAIRAEAMAAARALDAAGLRAALSRAVVGLTPEIVLDEVVGPLMRTMGEMWERGELDPGEEHLASGVVRRVLSEMIDAVTTEAESGPAPRIVVATPTGQRHEIGALMAAVAAAAQGWRITYLGADLPAESIVAATRRTRPRALAISLVHPEDDPETRDALERLAEAVDPGIEVLIGGAAAGSYDEALDLLDAVRIEDLEALRAELRVLDGGR